MSLSKNIAGLTSFDAYFSSMASNVDPKRTAESWTNNPPMHASFEDWLARHGKTAYKDFKNDHPTSKLSYEDWRQTDQVYGGYLFYAALLVWNEDGSSVRDQHYLLVRFVH